MEKYNNQTYFGDYDTFDVRILIDNEDIRSLDVNFLRKNILVLNQDFKKFDLSFKDNIILGKEFNLEKFNRILNQLNLFSLVNKLKNGSNTNLRKIELINDKIKAVWIN